MDIAYICLAPGTDVYENLAREEYLMELCVQMQVPIIYFWSNHKAVVIGRNQDAAAECDVKYAKENGIDIARRRSGGGAVYHDRDNLNYSFILPVDDLKMDSCLLTIQRALKDLGISAKITGRNDICLDGNKISGSAFYSDEGVSLCHGTMLIHCDTDTIARVLTPSASKLLRHGISSVASRVGDISSRYPHIDRFMLTDSMKKSFCRDYNIGKLQEIQVADGLLSELQKEYRSLSWIMDGKLGGESTD